MRLTLATVLVARALLSPQQPRPWGRDIARRAGVESGSVHPILERMEHLAWVTAHHDGSRRYYQVTETGRRELEELVARARRDARFTHLFPKTKRRPRES